MLDPQNTFFILSKSLWYFLRPDNLLILTTIICLLSISKKNIVLINRCAKTTALFLFLFTFIPLGNYMMYPLESDFIEADKIPKKIDGIIVLSGGVTFDKRKGSYELNEQADRDIAFVKLANQYKTAKLVYSGGSSKLIGTKTAGATAAKLMLDDINFDINRVLFESKSRNTYESAKNVDALINPSSHEVWYLVTSAFHMKRSVGAFCAVGWNVKPYAVDFKSLNYFRLNFNFSENIRYFLISTREYLGLFSYWVSGKAQLFEQTNCGLAAK